MSRRRKICVFTGARSEYGLLYWLMKDLEADPAVELQILVAGMHLAPEFGRTITVIEEDGFTPAAKVDSLVSGDSPCAVATSLGLATIKVSQALESLAPDIIVVLGDRYEALAAAQAAMVLNIPIAHLHGGEATEGVIDEAIRHSITKMAHLHFTAAEPYRRRVIQLGEQPDRVFQVGAPGLDNFQRLNLMDRAALESALDLSFSNTVFLVTYHPVTLAAETPEVATGELLAALDRFPLSSIVWTMANADSGGRRINRIIDDYAARNPSRVFAAASLGQVVYLSLMKLADVVIGNSSSGLIEAPTAGTPTVNIGPRQQGRLRAASVIDCAEETEAISDAITRALTADFQANAANVDSPYGNGGASARVAEILKNHPLDNVLTKSFYEIAGVPT